MFNYDNTQIFVIESIVLMYFKLPITKKAFLLTYFFSNFTARNYRNQK